MFQELPAEEARNYCLCIQIILIPILIGYVLIARHSVIMTKTEMNTVQFMNPGVGCIERSS